MKYRQEVKDRAYELDPTAWESYRLSSGAHKRHIDHLRDKSLDAACREFWAEGREVYEREGRDPYGPQKGALESLTDRVEKLEELVALLEAKSCA